MATKNKIQKRNLLIVLVALDVMALVLDSVRLVKAITGEAK